MSTQTKWPLILAGVALLTVTASLSAQTNLTPAKTKIGIMKFEVAKDLNPSLSGLLYDTLTEQVVNSKKFTVVDWESIDLLRI